MIDAARQVVAKIAHEEISLHSRWADIDTADAAWQDFHGRVQGMIDGDWGGNGESASMGFMSASR